MTNDNPNSLTCLMKTLCHFNDSADVLRFDQRQDRPIVIQQAMRILEVARSSDTTLFQRYKKSPTMQGKVQ